MQQDRGILEPEEMRVLIVSPSYFPEIGAAPSRITNMAEGLSGLGIEVDVLTCLPNYPKGRIFDGYRGAFSKKEDINGITVFRYWTYASISKKPLVRLVSMCAFATTLWCFVLKCKRIKSYDKVIIQTPPVLAAASAMLLFRCCYQKKVVLNVSDLWPLSAVELGAIKEGSIYHRVIGCIERFLYCKATAYQGQSKEIVDYIKQYEPDKTSFLYRNLQHRFVLPKQVSSHRRPFKIVYAGLLGVAQNILELVERIDFKGMGAELHLFGGGNQAVEIEDYVKTHDKGVFYHGSLPKEQMREELTRYHASIIPLTVRIKGAVPSKLFDLLPLGIPILFSGGGEGEVIVKEYRLGFVSAPGNYEQLSRNVRAMGCLPEEEYRKLKDNCLRLSQTTFSFERQLEEYKYFLFAL